MNTEKFIQATKAYVELTGLKVGSKVRVTHKVESNAYGWPSSWNHDMNEAIGKEFTVVAYDDYDGDFQLDDYEGYWYPFLCLEVITEPDTIIELESGDYNVVIKHDGSIEVGCQKISRKKLEEIYIASTDRLL